MEEIYFFKTNYNITFLFLVLFAAISPGIISFTLYTKAQRYLGVINWFYFYLYAVYGAIFGIILFEEMLLHFHYLGAILVFVGVYVARKSIK